MARSASKKVRYLGIIAIVLLLGFVVFQLTKSKLSTSSSPLTSAYQKIYHSEGVVGKTNDPIGPAGSEFEFQPPDTLRTTINMSGKTFESIVTANAVYSRGANGVWSKTPTISTSKPAFLPAEADLAKVTAREKNKANFALEKTENCPGKTSTCKIYKEKFDEGLSHRYYIDQSGYLIRDETYIKDSLNSWVDFEYKKVTIQVPTDVKEVTPPPAPDIDTSKIPADVKDQIEKMQAASKAAQ